MKKTILIITAFYFFATQSIAQTTDSNHRSWVQTSQTNDRIALVIGNSEYQHSSRLAEPANDAKAIKTALSQQGYDVELGYNLDRAELFGAIRDFSRKLKKYKSGIIFYAGHGFQIDGENYLIPTDANPNSPWEVSMQCMNVDNIFSAINDPSKPKVVILDACRNNPFANNWTGAERGAESGMAKVRALQNSLVIFSTAEGTKVKDRNPFTEILSDQIKAGGCIADILGNVSAKVVKNNPNQVIWTEGILVNQICFGSTTPSSIGEVPEPEKSYSSYSNNQENEDLSSQFGSDEKATLYFEEATSAYKNRDYNKSITYIKKAKQIMDGSNPSIAALEIQCHFALDDFLNANTLLENYISKHKRFAPEELNTTVLSLLVRIEDGAIAQEKEANQKRKEDEEKRRKQIAKESNEKNKKNAFPTIANWFNNNPKNLLTYCNEDALAKHIQFKRHRLYGLNKYNWKVELLPSKFDSFNQLLNQSSSTENTPNIKTNTNFTCNFSEVRSVEVKTVTDSQLKKIVKRKHKQSIKKLYYLKVTGFFKGTKEVKKTYKNGNMIGYPSNSSAKEDVVDELQITIAISDDIDHLKKLKNAFEIYINQ